MTSVLKNQHSAQVLLSHFAIQHKRRTKWGSDIGAVTFDLMAFVLTAFAPMSVSTTLVLMLFLWHLVNCIL